MTTALNQNFKKTPVCEYLEESNFLGHLERNLDWREIEKLMMRILAKRRHTPNRSGRREAMQLLKILILQYCHGLNDAQCQEFLTDRISWRQFAGLSLQDETPDKSVIVNFRTWLIENETHADVLALCQRQLTKRGFALQRGSIEEPRLKVVSDRQEHSGNGRPHQVTAVRRTGKSVNLYFFEPFSPEGNLGKAYNSYMKLVPNDGDWVCFMDRDVMFLTPDYGNQVLEIIETYPQAGLFTSLTNRIGCRSQLYEGRMSEDSDIVNHRNIAADLQQRHRHSVQWIDPPVSGFLMVFKKAVWNEVKFREDLQLLHVDWDFSFRMAKKGYAIGVMNGMYVFHYYRLMEGAADVSHLE